MKKTANVKLEKIYKRLFKAFGQQHWWPGQTKTEIIVGAILTQNTNWGNVEKALINLKKHGLLNFSKLKKTSPKRIANLIKPSGYFNIKTKRLKNFVNFLFKEYGGKLSAMGKEGFVTLREKVLGVNGVGPETADSMLLYAFDKPVFVVDAYTKRILSRHGLISENDEYHEIQGLFMSNLKNDAKYFNEYHALLVRVGKEFCRPKPRCSSCPLNVFKRY